MNNNIVEFLLDNMNVSAYIINKKDYRFIYVNTYLRNLFHNVDKGQICYKVLWNRDSPCHDCPIANNQKTVTRFQKYFHHVQKTFSIDAIKMDYDMQDIYIFTGHDITEQKLFENQLSKLAYYDSTLGIKNLYSFYQYFANVNICQIYLLKIKNMRNFYALYGQNYIDIILKKSYNHFHG